VDEKLKKVLNGMRVGLGKARGRGDKLPDGKRDCAEKGAGRKLIVNQHTEQKKKPPPHFPA